jgi:hypothetical protein
MPLARTSLRLHAALVLVFFLLAAPPAACAAEPAPAAPAPPVSHRTAHVALGVGAGLTVVSFLLAEAGDRAYERYEGETDPDRIEDAYDDAARYDDLAVATLVVGQVSLVYGLWRRFLHDPEARSADAGAGSARRGATWSIAPCLGPDGPALAFDLRF